MNSAKFLVNISDNNSLFNRFLEEGDVDKAALFVNSLFTLLPEGSSMDPAKEKKVSKA